LFTVLQAIKKLAGPRGRSPDKSSPPRDLTDQLAAATENLSAVTSCTEDCKSNVTTVTWLDDVRDLEDMENRLNEALELKMNQ
jgi:enamine deaminase RidA (YjgF/YER057c/UK114 family)